MKSREGAEFQTARNPEPRGIPNGAESRTAQGQPTVTTARRSVAAVRRAGCRCVLWDFAPSGISRRLEFRAILDSRNLGVSRH
jgi:hypothetical protein